MRTNAPPESPSHATTVPKTPVPVSPPEGDAQPLPEIQSLAERLREISGRHGNDSTWHALCLVENWSELREGSAEPRWRMELFRRLQECLRDGDSAYLLADGRYVLLLNDINADPVAVRAEIEGLVALMVASGASPSVAGSPAGQSSPGAIRSTTFRSDAAPNLGTLADLEDMFRVPRGDYRGFLRFVDDPSDALSVATEIRTILTDDLSRALQRQDFALHYLPEVAPDSRRVVGVQAVLRWNHPRHGVIYPRELLQNLDFTESTYQLALTSIRLACEQMTNWRDDPERGKWTIAVNINFTEVDHPLFADAVASMISETGADPQRLRIQAYDSGFLSDHKRLISGATRLRNTGCQVGLDNFGEGHASLWHLKYLPLDYLTLPDTFVGDDPDDQELLRGIVALSATVKLTVTVKGIQTEAQRRVCLEYGVDRCLGPLFDPPISAE